MATACNECKNPIEVWCPVCTKSLCSSCSQHHKPGKHHETIAYDNYLKLPPLIKNLNLECPEHGRIYRNLCRIHDQLLCSKCINRHSKCQETPKLYNIVNNVKSSVAFEKALQEIEKTSELLQKCVAV